MITKISKLAEPFQFEPKSNPKLALFLIHGYTASPTEIRPLGEYLYEKFNREIQVTSILLPGHGVDGPEGYKTLDTIHYQDWIQYVDDEITKFLNSFSCPIILGGLSMGSLLILQYLERNKSERIKGAIFLSPPFYIRSPFFPFLRYIKFVKKYQTKGPSAVDFYKKYNLFSYSIRSLKATDEFRKLVSKTKLYVQDNEKKIIVFLGEKDELVDVKKTYSFLSKNKNFILNLLPGFEHILTVYPESEEIFKEIYNWIFSITFD
jgi:carboxylesterase